MLSEQQKQFLIQKVNDDVNIPFVSEEREGRWIEKFVDAVLPQIEPALNMIMSEEYVTCVKTALDERIDVDERSDKISAVVRGDMGEPLSRQLTERVDTGILPGFIEKSIFKIVSNKIIEEFVEWTVGKVDAKFQDMSLDRELPVESADGSGASGSMLNARQREAAISRFNESVNVPLVSEEREERWMTKLFDAVDPHIEPSLKVILPDVYLESIKLALNERMEVKERQEKISDLMRGEMAEPLSRELDERVDSSFVPDMIEGKIFKVIAGKIIEEIVEWTVGKVDDKFEEK